MQIGGVGATRNPAFSGARLRAMRTERGWSRGRLAARIDASLPTIAGYERGQHTPPPPVLRRLADALGVDPRELLSMPIEEWTLGEHRSVTGLHQRDVAGTLSVAQDRLSRIELGYERPDDPLLQQLAELYASTTEQLTAAWERTRARLLHDDHEELENDDSDG